MEPQTVQKSALNEIREVKDTVVVKWHAKKQAHKAPKIDKRQYNCKYCGTIHLLRQCMAYIKNAENKNTKWLGHLPRLQEVRVHAPPGATFFLLS